MTIDRRVMLATMATMAGLAAGFGPLANAQSKAAWPTKTVKFIVGAAAGGSASDAATRFFANQIAERSKQPVVVDNRPGADGNLAAEVVARSAPDGHTFLVTGNNTHAANVHLYKSMSFDPEKDFAPVTTYARVPYVLLINGNRLAARTLKDFIADARANPGKLTYASAAVASRVGVEQLKLTAKFDAVNVAYKSGAQAMTDLLGGHVDFYIADAVNALQQVQAGRAIALGVTVAERLPAAPDLPTIAESGFPDFDFASWLAVWTSAGTPPELVRAASAAINDAMGSPAGKQFLEKQGLLPYPGSPEALRTLQQRETLRWGQAIRAAQMVAH
ncbi:tripartite tricarboxylate transporter substrate binding protein [Verminephrobacter eiseniae]|uniref:Bug family tripartite tricarboxylate transporter substrate binding protein n=1 Tax=Verminephrobacter eiseniae TaxID=364317 RepID=UPI002238C16E|nr:tripartite tricarboxylate transporter substrate binding protein [Verminephrobacter eiseniae]MCW5258937.1 tripartite tricarboxylate transporter substrate binding protein [Verminephrobacter eiseniae]